MLDWGRMWLIAKREVSTRFKQRSYRVTLVIQLLVAAVAALAPVGMAWLDDGRGDEVFVVVVDNAQSGVADRMADTLATQGEGFDPIGVRTDARTVEDARSVVADGDADYAVIVTPGEDDALAYEFVSEDGATSGIDAQRIVAAITAFSVEHMAAQRGLTTEEAQALVAAPEIRIESVSGEASGSEDESSAEWGVAYAGTIVIYMAIILYGTWVANGVAEEKSSRIMEIMINAATPRELLFGKVLGIMLAGLAQLVPMLLVAGTLFALQPRIAEAVDVSLTATFDIDFASVSVTAVATFLVYFLFGFLLYGALYAGIGSMVSRQEEVNQAVAPMMTMVIVAFFVAIVAMNAPESTFAKVLMYIPFISPLVALPRVLLGTPGVPEIASSIALLVVAAIGAMWLASALYRSGVLMYGQTPGWKSLLRVGRMQHVAR